MTNAPDKQALCGKCGFSWPLRLHIPEPDADKQARTVAARAICRIRCPRCIKNRRHTNYTNISIGERES